MVRGLIKDTRGGTRQLGELWRQASVAASQKTYHPSKRGDGAASRAFHSVRGLCNGHALWSLVPHPDPVPWVESLWS
jgi:hypothetical protein